MDAVNRILFVNNVLDEKINQFIKQIIPEDDVIIWGSGEVAISLMPKIKNAGKKISLIVDNDYKNKGVFFDELSISKPETLNNEKDKALVILTEKYCDDIFAQILAMNLDETLRIYKFTDLNEEYIRLNQNEIEDYMFAKYDFYREFVEFVQKQISEL